MRFGVAGLGAGLIVRRTFVTADFVLESQIEQCMGGQFGLSRSLALVYASVLVPRIYLEIRFARRHRRGLAWRFTRT